MHNNPSPQSSYRRSRKEAIVAGLLWVVAGLWTISVSYWLGYSQPPRPVAGIPNWVVWGIFLPWIIFFVIHTWYSLFYIRDDEDPGRPDSDPAKTQR